MMEVHVLAFIFRVMDRFREAGLWIRFLFVGSSLSRLTYAQNFLVHGDDRGGIRITTALGEAACRADLGMVSA
jgi:hypothetical protein